MISILFFIVAIIIGTLLVYLLKIEIFLEEKLFWGLVLGSLVLTVFCFVFSLIFGFTPSTIYLSFFILIIIILIVSHFFRKIISKELRDDFKIFRERLKNKKIIRFLVIFVICFIFFLTLWSRVIYQDEKGIFTIGTAGVWGDWAAHLSYVSHFLYSDKISLDHPLFAGAKFAYTFMADFQSAMLMKLGENLISAMTIPGFIYSLALVVLLYYFALRLTKKASSAILTIILYFLGSGLSFIYFFQDLKTSPFSQSLNLWKNTLIEYTNLPAHNVHWTSFFNTLWLPQRSFTIGLPVGILILSLIFWALDKKSNKLFLIAGLISSLLPTIHLHSLLAISVVGFFLIIFLSRNRKIAIKNLFYFFGPIVIFGLWQILYLFSTGGSGLKFHFGWMTKNESWILFWVKNSGFFFILLPIAFWFVGNKLKKIYLAFFSLFVLANLVLFQPHDYDNIKIMNYWFLMTALILAIFLVKVFGKNILGKLFVVILFPFLIFSAFLDVSHLYFHTSYLLLNQEDIENARLVGEKTSAESVFLTSDKHNHFLPMLTGRKILMGYRGWLWTYGINYEDRFQDELTMYQGGSGAENLLAKYKVNYVVIGPSEKTNFQANEIFFDQNYLVIIRSENYKIYKIVNQ